MIWAVTAYYMVPLADSATRYWILGDFTAMTPTGAVFYLSGVLWAAYLLIVTVMVMPAAYSVFVRAQVGSDQRLKELLGPPLWKATKLWFALVGFALVIGVVTNLIAPGAQHLFKREAWTGQSHP